MYSVSSTSQIQHVVGQAENHKIGKKWFPISKKVIG